MNIRVEVPLRCRFRYPIFVRLVPLAIPLGIISRRLMMAWLKMTLVLACLEMNADGRGWEPVEIDLEFIFPDDDDDDNDGGTPVLTFAPA